MLNRSPFLRTALMGVLLSIASTTVAQPLTFSLNRLQDGETVAVSEKDFVGKYLLIAVGYTGCPDICPTTMLDIRSALEALDKHPQQAAKIQPLFITIDPKSDTLKDITEYAAWFDPRIIGLRADNFEQLDDVVAQLHASYGYRANGKPVLPADLPKRYTVMHSTFMYLYSPAGELLDAYPYNLEGKLLAKQLLQQVSQ